MLSERRRHGKRLASFLLFGCVVVFSCDFTPLKVFLPAAFRLTPASRLFFLSWWFSFSGLFFHPAGCLFSGSMVVEHFLNVGRNVTMFSHVYEAAGLVVLALDNPKACLLPGFEGPVGTVLGWVKGLGLLIGIVSLIRVGVHMLRQQGDGVPDRDDTSDKLVNWAIGVLIISFAVSIFSALGLSVTSC